MIIGGANSAGQAAVYFANWAAQVTMLVRSDSLTKSMSSYLIEQIAALPNIDVRTGTEAIDAQGDDDHLKCMTLRDGDGNTTVEDVDACFVFVGAAPRTDWLGATVARDDHGFILAGADARASGLAAQARPLRVGDQRPRRVRRGRRPGALDQARRQRGGRGVDGGLADPRVPRGGMTPTVPVTLEQIRAVDLFDGLDDDELEAWREATQAFRIASGEIVHEQDTSPRGLLLLLDGDTRMYKLADERFEPIGQMHAPTWMQAIAALTETPVGVRMVAEGDCVIGLVPIGRRSRISRSSTAACTARSWPAIGPVTARLQAIDNDRERLASLGTMAAGLAHELNNPAAAVQRAASQMADTLDTVMDVLASFVEAGVEREGAEKLVALQREAVDAGRGGGGQARRSTRPTPRTRCSTAWRTSGVDEAWRLAEVLAGADLDDAWLQAVRDAAGPDAMSKALAWVAATLSARGLAEELQESAARMSDLVGAIKTYSYMDRGEVVIVDVREGIKATVKVLGHKLKHTNISGSSRSSRTTCRSSPCTAASSTRSGPT